MFPIPLDPFRNTAVYLPLLDASNFEKRMAVNFADSGFSHPSYTASSSRYFIHAVVLLKRSLNLSTTIRAGFCSFFSVRASPFGWNSQVIPTTVCLHLSLYLPSPENYFPVFTLRQIAVGRKIVLFCKSCFKLSEFDRFLHVMASSGQVR